MMAEASVRFGVIPNSTKMSNGLSSCSSLRSRDASSSVDVAQRSCSRHAVHQVHSFPQCVLWLVEVAALPLAGLRFGDADEEGGGVGQDLTVAIADELSTDIDLAAGY